MRPGKMSSGCTVITKGLTPFMDSLKENSMVFSKCQSAGPYTQASFPAILCSGYYLDYGKPEGLAPDAHWSRKSCRRPAFTPQASIPTLIAVNARLGPRAGILSTTPWMTTSMTSVYPYIRGDAINTKVTDWLSSHTGKKDYAPFFLWLHYMDVHEPYMPERTLCRHGRPFHRHQPG